MADGVAGVRNGQTREGQDAYDFTFEKTGRPVRNMDKTIVETARDIEVQVANYNVLVAELAQLRVLHEDTTAKKAEIDSQSAVLLDLEACKFIIESDQTNAVRPTR